MSEKRFLCPMIGSVVTVTTEYPDHYYLSDQKVKRETYENALVVKPFPWTKPGNFCIKAEEGSPIDVRTIALNSVVAMTVNNTDGVLGRRTGTKVVKVEGSKGDSYNVTVIDGIARTCDCLGFTYRKRCRHLKVAMGEKSEAEKVSKKQKKRAKA